MVSILQLMGFSKGKPVNSPAEEKPAKKAQETSSRRDDVKAKPGAKSDPKAAKGKPAVASKSVPAVAAKPAAKPASKVAAKAVKPAAKAASKVAVKPAVKPAVKSAAKVGAKATAKPTVPTPTKAVAVKSAKPEPKVAKASAKAVAKTPAKTIPPVSVAAKPVARAKAPLAPPAAVVKEKTPMSATPTPAKAMPAPAASAAASAPAKAGRPSSRLAQLTVPSMAQTVASTAAKASYSQTVTSEPPPPVLPAAVKKDAKLVNSWKTKPVAELTDADLLAMPDSEYMNDVQMAAFRLKLVALKADILSNAGETTEHLREDSAVVPDPADRATIEEEHALELRTRDRERKLLKKIEQSIVRIDAGDYGYCDETGEAIGVGRLLARPTATLSLEAQQRRELKQKMFGD